VNTSPFSTARFEYDAKHLYYLPEDIMAHIETTVPKFLIGSRGTGKTTFLKALWWKERLQNASLQHALSDGPLFAEYIGLYLKVPDIQAQIFNRWSPELDPEHKGEFFSLYLELMICQLAVEAVLGLEKAGKLEFAVKDEHQLCRDIVDNYKLNLFDGFASGRNMTLKRIEQMLWQAHVSLAHDLKSAMSPDKISKKFGVCGFGDFCKTFMSHIHSITGLKSKSFKICLDECECLNHEQLLVLNTLIRKSEHPISYIVAFVREPHDMNATYIPRLTLQRADRDVIALDEYAKDDKKFEDFADGVASVRIRSILNRDQIEFKTRNILGNLNINKLLAIRLKSSESLKAREILKLAEDFATTDFYKDQKTKKEEADKSLPIYYAFLYNRLNLDIPTKSTPSWKRRNQESREIRKKMVSAYLAICAECNLDIWFAYAEMLLQTCDSCLRDYLWQMQALFDKKSVDLTLFTTCTISEKVQSDALKSASRQKRDSIIVQDRIRSPEKTERLIDGLARITKYIQTTSPNNQHLKSTERGLFSISIPRNASDAELDLIRIIGEASEAGFLRIVSQDSLSMKFRVHTSLAPEYGFSYRGAYYPSQINTRELSELVLDEVESSRNKKIEHLSKLLAGYEDHTMPLFEGKDVWNE
jgi:hypothetical protein